MCLHGCRDNIEVKGGIWHLSTDMLDLDDHGLDGLSIYLHGRVVITGAESYTEKYISRPLAKVANKSSRVKMQRGKKEIQNFRLICA